MQNAANVSATCTFLSLDNERNYETNLNKEAFNMVGRQNNPLHGEQITLLLHVHSLKIMAAFNEHQVNEINEVIAQVAKAVKAKSEIGAHDKPLLESILKNQKPARKATYFKCRREHSDAIVTHFVKDKGVAKSRFHKHHQVHIFVLN